MTIQGRPKHIENYNARPTVFEQQVWWVAFIGNKQTIKHQSI